MGNGTNVGLLVAGGAVALLGALGGYLAAANQPVQPEIVVNEKPDLCAASGSVKNQPVLIKVGKEPDPSKPSEDRVVIQPVGDCEVARGSALAWVADTDIAKISIAFVQPDPAVLCMDAKPGPSPENGGSDTIEQNLAPLPPLTILMNSKPGRQEYGYCLTINGDMVTPNPAIIIKPD